MKTNGDPDRICNDKSRLPGILDEFDIRLLYAGYDDLPAGAWDHDRLVNDFWRLYRNDSPGGALTCGEETIDMISGGIYLVPSGLSLSSMNSGRIGQFFVHFDLRGVSPFAFRDLFPGPVLAGAGDDFERVVSHVGNKVARLGTDAMSCQCQLKGIIYAAFGYYLEHLPSHLIEASWVRLQAMHPIMPALQMIERELDRPLNNGDLANACAMSTDHFIRRFRHAVGMTPAAFIQHKRLAMASQLLLYSDDSIDMIAAKTGFTDRFYFSRVFRRTMGIPPATYRRLPRT